MLLGLSRFRQNDPYSNDVIALLHCDGPNNSTSFIDQTGRLWTNTTGCTISTTTSQFGGASLLNVVNGGGIGGAASSDFDFGSNDFTFEFWLNPTILPAGGRLAGVYSKSVFGIEDGIEMWLDTTGTLQFREFIGTTPFVVSDNAVIATNTWTYYACVRDGSNLRMYKGFSGGNAVQVGSTPISGSANSTPTTDIRIALLQDQFGPVFNDCWIGYIDEIRVTKNICRYPNGTTFAIQTAEWIYP
jgi:Concanavalin A-like lectin/glucanases superfamily